MDKSIVFLRKNIKNRLSARGQDQSDLAKALKVKPPTVSRMLSEKGSAPTLDTVERIAGVLGCDAWELLRPAEAMLQESLGKPDHVETVDARRHAEDVLKPGVGSARGQPRADANESDGSEKSNKLSPERFFDHAPSSSASSAILTPREAPDSRLALFGAIVSRLAALNEAQLRFILPYVDAAMEINGPGQRQELRDKNRKL